MFIQKSLATTSHSETPCNLNLIVAIANSSESNDVAISGDTTKTASNTASKTDSSDSSEYEDVGSSGTG